MGESALISNRGFIGQLTQATIRRGAGVLDGLGMPISPTHVVRRFIFPACTRLGAAANVGNDTSTFAVESEPHPRGENSVCRADMFEMIVRIRASPASRLVKHSRSS